MATKRESNGGVNATNKLIYQGIYLPSVIELVVYKHVPIRMQVTTRITFWCGMVTAGKYLRTEVSWG